MSTALNLIVKVVKKLLQSGQNIGFSHVFLEIFPKISRAPRAPKKVKRAPRASRAPKIAYEIRSQIIKLYDFQKQPCTQLWLISSQKKSYVLKPAA